MSAAAAAAQLTRRERRVAETRRAIVASARELFETQGFSATTVEQVADAADVSPRTLFRYFPTKASLLFADFDATREQMLEVLESRPVGEDPFASLGTALRWMATHVATHRGDITWGFRLCHQQAVEGVPERYLMKEQTDRRIAEFLADRLGVDVDTDPRPTAVATAAMGVFVAAMRRSSQAEMSTEDTVALVDSLLSGAATALAAIAETP